MSFPEENAAGQPSSPEERSPTPPSEEGLRELAARFAQRDPAAFEAIYREFRSAVYVIGILEPANLAVLFELRKPEPRFDLIGKLMRRFVYTAGITGVLQIGTLVIMTYLPT